MDRSLTVVSLYNKKKTLHYYHFQRCLSVRLTSERVCVRGCYSANMAHSEAVRKLLEHLQSDLKNISLEAKRRHPGVKESAEEAIVKERTSSHYPFSSGFSTNSVTCHTDSSLSKDYTTELWWAKSIIIFLMR